MNPLMSKINTLRHRSKNGLTLKLFSHVHLAAWFRDILTIDFVYIALNFSLSEQLLINVPLSLRVFSLKMGKSIVTLAQVSRRPQKYIWAPPPPLQNQEQVRVWLKAKSRMLQVCDWNIRSRSSCQGQALQGKEASVSTALLTPAHSRLLRSLQACLRLSRTVISRDQISEPLFSLHKTQGQSRSQNRI